MTDANKLKESWKKDARWKGIVRPYSAEEVIKLRGSVLIEYTLAKMGAKKLWEYLSANEFLPALGAITGTQAVQQVTAGLKAIYCSGWQVAGDNNSAFETYPDQSLYPVDSVPNLVKRINKAFQRTDQITSSNGQNKKDWFAPIIADAEAGFGGVLNAYELMKAMIDAGASGVHFEDQLSSAKKCGHMGGKVVVPSNEFIKKLIAARLASDVLDVPTIIVARTDADSASLLASDVDERDRKFIIGDRTEEGFFKIKNGVEAAIARALAYAPYADMMWCETSKPDLAQAKQFAEGVHQKYPGKFLAYNCSPSFNWQKNLDAHTIAKFQKELKAMGYQFQFVTLAGFHVLNYSMFKLAKDYAQSGMSAYSELQQNEMKEKDYGYAATEHQSFVGTGYFDEISEIISGGKSSTLAMKDSTEKAQF